MARIAFDLHDVATSRAIPPAQGIAPGLPFTATEFAVIHLGAGDDPASLREPGPIMRAVHHFLGVRRNNRLADPRLETLRRTTLLLKADRELAPADRDRFLAVGFTGEQLDLLRILTGA